MEEQTENKSHDGKYTNDEGTNRDESSNILSAHENNNGYEIDNIDIQQENNNDDNDAINEQEKYVKSNKNDIDIDTIVSTTTSESDNDDNDNNSVELNEFDDNQLFQSIDVQSISLLRQIFPDETTSTLKEIHTNQLLLLKKNSQNIHSNNSNAQQQQQEQQCDNPNDTINSLVNHNETYITNDESNYSDNNIDSMKLFVQLPDDFLRLPQSFAVRRYVVVDNNNNSTIPKVQYTSIQQLATIALQRHNSLVVSSSSSNKIIQNNNIEQHNPITATTTTTSKRNSKDGYYYSSVLYRHEQHGHGMTICLIDNMVRVYSVTSYDGQRYTDRKHYTTIHDISGTSDSDSSSSRHQERVQEQECVQKQLHENDDDNQQQQQQQQHEQHLNVISGPAIDVGIVPGDIVIGIDGVALVESCSPDESLLRHAAAAMRYSSDPLVIHLYRDKHFTSTNTWTDNYYSVVGCHPTTSTSTFNNTSTTSNSVPVKIQQQQQQQQRTVSNDTYIPPPPLVVTLDENESKRMSSLLDTSSFLNPNDDDDDIFEDLLSNILPESPQLSSNVYIRDTIYQSTPIQWLNNVGSKTIQHQHQHHPFVTVLSESGLIHSAHVHRTINVTLKEYDNRTRQLESLSSLKVPFNNKNKNKSTKSLSASISPSTNYITIPMIGVRTALCVRVVNSFVDTIDTAYTLWVYDVMNGTEWYAPVRYYHDFVDLRLATIQLYNPISTIPFPTNNSKNLIRKNNSSNTAATAFSLLFRSPSKDEKLSTNHETTCLVLESFIRTLCSLLYKEKVHTNMAEIAVLVQSFLGCDCATSYLNTIECNTNNENNNHNNDDKNGSKNGSCNEDHAVSRIRLRLKRSIQLHTYRIFLLDVMENLVSDFVLSIRTNAPKLKDIELLESKGTNILKTKAMDDLIQLQSYLDKIQDMIIEGCSYDFKSISERYEYKLLQQHINCPNTGTTYWERIVREAVREQVEIEVYVPLRSIVSRWLVNGWRHEDMEVQFKIKELRLRPISYFRIPDIKSGTTTTTTIHNQIDDSNHFNYNGWSSVSKILNEGVSFSTLPCIKLRAIVAAAREILRIVSETKAMSNNTNDLFGADDFLPIFIYCMVHSEIERPCALCVLLRTLCDDMNKIGEIGYYLASFEAAILYFQDLDLTETQQEMNSFLSVPLDDI